MRLLGLCLLATLFGGGVTAQEPTGPPDELQIVGTVFVAVQVRDLTLTAEWYRTTFAMEEANRIETDDRRYSFLILAGDGIDVELLQTRDAASVPSPALGLFKVGLHRSHPPMDPESGCEYGRV